ASGGGIWVAGTGGFITACTIAANQAIGGAGGRGYDLHGSDHASAGGGLAHGGGIGVAAPLTLTNCTIANNAVGAGRGRHAILATNSAATGPDVFGKVSTVGFNLIGKTDGSSGWFGTDLRGTVAKPLDPKLAPLANNGGPTQTMALLAGSPAIDKGKSFNLTT